VTQSWYADLDQDGHGDPDNVQQGCEASAVFVSNSDDCDDTDESIHPEAVEICNGIDDNCNSEVDEELAMTAWYFDQDADGYGEPSEALEACEHPSGYVDNGDDCDDRDGLINPEADEICDDIDNDCDNLIDGQDDDIVDGLLWYRDKDGDEYGLDDDNTFSCSSQPPGYVEDGGDCNDTDETVHPGASEICNDNIDNDCDGWKDNC